MGEARAAVQPMEGRGAYNRNSRVQATGMLAAVALLEEAARAASLAASPETIVVADYGASGAGTRSSRRRRASGPEGARRRGARNQRGSRRSARQRFSALFGP